MDNKYKVFQKGFHKVLDLVETADDTAIQFYEKFIGQLPAEVLLGLVTCEDFVIDDEKYNADMVRLVNELSFQYVLNQKFSQTSLSVHRVLEEDLYKDVVNIKIFSYSYRNTKIKPEPFKVYFEERDGKYFYQGNNKKQNNDLDVKCEVYLLRDDNEFFLRSVRTINGWEIYDKQIPVTFDEIIHCVEDEEEYEEEIEMELDFDI